MGNFFENFHFYRKSPARVHITVHTFLRTFKRPHKLNLLLIEKVPLSLFCDKFNPAD